MAALSTVRMDVSSCIKNKFKFEKYQDAEYSEAMSVYSIMDIIFNVG